jgi:hypothetical protein
MNKIILGCFLLITTGVSAQQTDMSLIPFRQGDKWGYTTADRNIVIQPKFKEANWFSEGFASVKIGNKFGYINKAGKLVIPAKFTVAKPFRKGYLPRADKQGGDSVLFAGASLVASGVEICINTKGKTTPKCPAMSESSYPENKMPVETILNVKNYTLPNNNGLFDKILDDYKISGFEEIYYVAVKNGQYGVFNSKFDTIIPFQFTSIKVNRKSVSPFLEVNKNGKYGVLTTDGKIAINPEYVDMYTVSVSGDKTLIVLRKDGKTFVKDMNNNDIISNVYTDIVYDNEGFVLTDANNLQGYYFTNNSIIQPKYSEVKRMSGSNFLMVKTNTGKFAYVNAAGVEFFSE